MQNAVMPAQVGTATGSANFFRSLVSAVVVALLGAIVLGGVGGATGVSVETIESALTHEKIETALVFVKAGGLSRATAKSVLHLCTTLSRLPQGDIDKGLASFDRLKSATAQELVRFYQLREASVARKQ